MAVNIGQTPQEYAMSGNALTYTFTSDQTNQTNFYFKVEVYKDAVLQSEHRVYADNGTYGRFDLSEIAEYELTKPNIPTSNYVDAGNYADFYIVVKEFYGVTPVEGASATSYTSTIFKAKSGNFESWYFGDYFPSAFGGNLLTYFDSTKLYPNELFYLYALNLPSDPYAEISYRTQSGLEAHLYTMGLATYDCIGVKLDYLTLQANFAPIAPVTWEQIVYIEVKITNSTDYYNTYTIYPQHDVTCIKPTRVHWLNKRGGMESFSFTRPTREQQKTNVRKFETSDSKWFGTFFGLSNDDTGNATFNTDSDKILTLNTGAISQADQKIMYDNLMTSPYVLIEWEDRLIRVSRDSVTVNYNQDLLDQIFYVELTVNIENFVSMTI